jgi:hypothetical protein
MTPLNEKENELLRKRLKKVYYYLVIFLLLFLVSVTLLIVNLLSYRNADAQIQDFIEKQQLTGVSLTEALEQRKDALIQKQ